MSTTKKISGNYTLQTLNVGDTINLDSTMVVINGNLVVTGNSQSIVSTDSAITDHTITLNNGVTSPNPLGANIIVDRGTTPNANVSIAWNESLTAWQATNDGITYKYLQLGSTPSANVYGDSAPTLSANLNLNGHTIYSPQGSVQIFANTANSGGSGIYVTNTVTTGAELVTKAKAVAYSIVFG
jgi:hypothetical protein